MAKPNIPLFIALKMTFAEHGSCECEYDIRNCPVFWRMVFVRHFGTKPVPVDPAKSPKGDDDPRWDALLKRAMRTKRFEPLRKHLAADRRQKAAS